MQCNLLQKVIRDEELVVGLQSTRTPLQKKPKDITRAMDHVEMSPYTELLLVKSISPYFDETRAMCQTLFMSIHSNWFLGGKNVYSLISLQQ